MNNNMNIEAQTPNAKMELVLTPNKEKDTVSLSLTADDMPAELASHLAAHVSDAVSDFLDCIGASGFTQHLSKNPETGETKELATKGFGPEAAKFVPPTTIN